MPGDALDAWAAELRLSSRQAEVLRLMVSGSSNLEISGVLGVTLGTAKQYVRAVYAAAGVWSRTELVIAAVKREIRFA